LAGKLNLAALSLLGCAYLVLFAVLVRALRLIRPSDVADLRALGMSRVNRALDRFVGVA
jgi:hypothetical protein